MSSIPKYLTITNFHNPVSGYKSASQALIGNLMSRFDQYISKDISIKVYIDGDNFVFKCKVPSEKNYKYKTDVFYDTIIEFSPIDKKDDVELKKIINYRLRVFSNNPQDTFVFTYTWNKMGALYNKIPTTNYSKEALREPSNHTNPSRFVGISKSIFYSLRKIFEISKYDKEKLIKLAEKLPNDKSFKFPGNLFDNIVSQNDKLKEVQLVEKDRVQNLKNKKDNERKKNQVGSRSTNHHTSREQDDGYMTANFSSSTPINNNMSSRLGKTDSSKILVGNFGSSTSTGSNATHSLNNANRMKVSFK